MKNKSGFTMVELLVVLVIVAILAAVATPIYLANVQRSRASEAVGTMALIRQSLRDYQINGASYFDITSNNIQNTLPTSVAADGTPSPAASGVNVNAGVTPYFSNAAFTVLSGSDLPTGSAFAGITNFATPDAVNFIIAVNGANSVDCTDAGAVLTNCATQGNAVANYRLEMDNSGRTFVSYAGGAAGTWAAY